MRTLPLRARISFALAAVVGLASAAGCGGIEPYYSGDGPEITDIRPKREDGITGCNVVRIEVDDLDQCTHPSVVFANRNATVVGVGTQEVAVGLIAAMEKTCDVDIELQSDAITVISPPGPIATGEVDVRVACEHGVGVAEEGYEYEVQHHPNEDEGPAYADLFKDERGSFSLQFYDSTLFGGVPFLGGYGFINGQTAARGATFWGGNSDSVASSTGIKAQIPPRTYAPPDVDRLQAGDFVRFYKDRAGNDPFGTVSGQWIQVYVTPSPSADCGYSGGEEDARSLGVCTYKVDDMRRDGDDIVVELGTPSGGLGGGGAEPDVFNVPTGDYYVQLCTWAPGTGDIAVRPSAGDCLLYEAIDGVRIETGATRAVLPDEVGIDMVWDGDIRYYTDDFMGPNESPFDKPLCMAIGESFSYGVNIEGIDYGSKCAEDFAEGTTADLNALGAISLAPIDMEAINADSRTPDGASLDNTIGAVHVTAASLKEAGAMDWDEFDPGRPNSCPGLLVRWNPDEGDRELSKFDYYTVDFRVWDDLMPSNFFGTFEVFRLTAFAWHRQGGICIPPSELAKVPPSMYPFGSTVATDAYVPTRYTAYLYINHHRVNAVDMGGDLGRMVVDAKTIDVTIYSNVSACENGEDDDGDGLVDAADPGCSSSDGFFEGISACANGEDDDGDGWEDGDDPGCADDTPEDETDAGTTDCSDGQDNDGDAWIDAEDPGCEDGFDDDEVDSCSDGLDNDGDGWTDLLDAECHTGNPREDENNTFSAYECSDGVDNDGDGLLDVQDPDCIAAGTGLWDSESPDTCADGLDNDGDGWVDLADPECLFGTETEDATDVFSAFECSDGVDNDGDGLLDVDDPECAAAGTGTWDSEAPGTCGDGLDNDGDGWTDLDDAECHFGTETEDETDVFSAFECSDGVDNDGDGLLDVEDPECLAAGTGLWDSEAAAPACSNGLDDDGDGWIDAAQDPGCGGDTAADDEGGLGTTACNDGVDNDSDGSIDAEDPECLAAGTGAWDSEAP